MELCWITGSWIGGHAFACLGRAEASLRETRRFGKDKRFLVPDAKPVTR